MLFYLDCTTDETTEYWILLLTTVIFTLNTLYMVKYQYLFAVKPHKIKKANGTFLRKKKFNLTMPKLVETFIKRYSSQIPFS